MLFVEIHELGEWNHLAIMYFSFSHFILYEYQINKFGLINSKFYQLF